MNKMEKKILMSISVIVLLAVAGLSFYGGILLKGSQQRSALFGKNSVNNARFQNGTSVVSGNVISKDEKSITVKTKDGSSRIVFYSDLTDVGKFVSGNTSDVAVGNTVMITGKQGTDGSVTAQSIQIRPAGSPLPGGPGQGGNQQP